MNYAQSPVIFQNITLLEKKGEKSKSDNKDKQHFVQVMSFLIPNFMKVEFFLCTVT